MDELRLILIIIGLILLAAIYWMGRRDERRAQEKKSSQHSPTAHTSDSMAVEDPWIEDVTTSPSESSDYDSFYVSDTDSDIFFKAPETGDTFAGHTVKLANGAVSTPKAEPVMVSKVESAPQTIELPAGIDPLLINLTVMAPEDTSFDPHYLKQILDDSGLCHGDMNIYHYYRKPKLEFESSREQRLFSVANVIEPGYFDPRNINTYRTPGIALFLQLPGPIDGVLAFEKMHQMGELLSKRLSGILCDDKHNKITPQSITHIKDQISEHSLKMRATLGRVVH